MSVGDFIGNVFTGGALAQKDRAGNALDSQMQASKNANANITQGYNQNRALLNPYSESQTGNFSDLMSGVKGGQFDYAQAPDLSLQTPGALAPFKFDASNIQNDPGLQFQKQQGEEAIRACTASRVIYLSANCRARAVPA